MGNKHGNNTNNEVKKNNKIRGKKFQSEDKNNSNKTKEIYKYNILFVGEEGIGTKTSLIKRIKEGKFIDNIEKDKVYKEKIIYEKDNKEIILYLIDTNAEKEKLSPKDQGDARKYIINKYYKNANCIIMGYDVTNKQSFEEIKSFWYNKINENAKTIL